MTLRQGFLEAVGISPSEKDCVLGPNARSKVNGPRHVQVLPLLIELPTDWTLVPSPLHRVGFDPVHWSQTHFIQLLLEAHISNAEHVVFVCFQAFGTEVEPGVIVAVSRVGQPITRHEKFVTIWLLGRPLAIVEAA